MKCFSWNDGGALSVLGVAEPAVPSVAPLIFLFELVLYKSDMLL